MTLDESLQQALGSGLRALEERIALAQSLRREAEKSGHVHVAESWGRKLADYDNEAQILRDSMRRIDQIAASAVQEINNFGRPGRPPADKALKRPFLCHARNLQK